MAARPSTLRSRIRLPQRWPSTCSRKAALVSVACRLRIPFGGGVGKIFKIGKQPLNAQVQAFYNVEKPDGGADWTLRLQLQFLFPK